MSTSVLPGQKGGSADVPAYQKIEEDLRSRIADGIWQAGYQIPGRRLLAKSYRVEVNTLQRAVNNLLADGTLRAENGRGTFVAERNSSTAIPQRSRSALTKTVGITAFVDEIALAEGRWLPSTMTIVKAIETHAKSNGMNTRFLNRWQASQNELSPAQTARDLLSEGVDVVCVVDAFTDQYVVGELRAASDLADKPVIYVSTFGEYVPCTHVFCDSHDAGFKAAKKLCAEGYREITFLAPYSNNWWVTPADGARFACESFGGQVQFRVFPTDGRFEYSLPDRADRIELFLDSFVRDGGIRGGIIAAHDALAIPLIEQASAHGCVAGRDYGLIGFDDDPLAITRGLTTIRPSLEELGYEAVRLARTWAESSRQGKIVSLHATLVERTSHRKAKG